MLQALRKRLVLSTIDDSIAVRRALDQREPNAGALGSLPPFRRPAWRGKNGHGGAPRAASEPGSCRGSMSVAQGGAVGRYGCAGACHAA